jgi:hypothetical protein
MMVFRQLDIIYGLLVSCGGTPAESRWMRESRIS